ncbi:YaaA family protein [Actinomarinicola tropica]|uniref:Peroxide stress protein YaaA n=1 Tax=Actinomarinicola tropica TaxID=2789776 RepID=A0A5Q2RKR7_9ACTN|nr:peroxide stress protein YaaA [Actinomarinicola tropica]QGG95016.1 peroxide stress protein YaaA [Actinomarinicola tropica]
MPTAPPLILIPPSEGKAPGGGGPTWRRGQQRDGALDRHRAAILPIARRAGAVAPRAATMPAIDRFTGVLYRELDWHRLPTAARRRGEDQVRIVSGLLGLVAPDDPVPDHRLKMSANLPGTGRLSTWWRPRLAPVLGDLAAGRVVWDLLPQEHAAACDWSAAVPHRRVTVRFVDGSGRTVSHWNKLLKGALVRWLLVERPRDVDALGDFEHPAGYRLDPAASVLDAPDATVVLRER